MSQNQKSNIWCGSWRQSSAWPLDHQPTGLWRWITHSGSLTEMLRAAANVALRVQVLHEGDTALDSEDAHLLNAPIGIKARMREVYLHADVPWVFARTLALVDGSRWMDNLGTQPLGERVFAETGTWRSSIEVAQLDPAQPLYQSATQHAGHQPPLLWARRSVLTVGGSPLLIYECFLAGMRY